MLMPATAQNSAQKNTSAIIFNNTLSTVIIPKISTFKAASEKSYESMKRNWFERNENIPTFFPLLTMYLQHQAKCTR